MANEKQVIEFDEDLILRLWDGDESVKAKLLVDLVPGLEIAVSRRFRRFSSMDVEDVVAEAIRRFWQSRETYDPARGSVRACLYRRAIWVAQEYATGRLKWQKTRLKERSGEAEFLACSEVIDKVEEELDELEREKPALVKAFAEVFARLPDIQKDIWETYAYADGDDVDAGKLGVKLGNKYKGGVPIPAGTIRVYKNRGKKNIVSEMKQRGFDLRSLGYLHD